MSLFLILKIVRHKCVTNFFAFCQYIFTPKTLLPTFEKLFSVFIFCFVKHESVKIFYIHIMWLVSIDYKQQIHWIFKFLVWSVDWKGQFIFITKKIDASLVFCFNFTKIFFWYRKFDFTAIKIVKKRIMFLRNSLWMYFYWINMPTTTPKKTFLIVILMLISVFLHFLIHQEILCRYFLIMVYKLKC